MNLPTNQSTLLIREYPIRTGVMRIHQIKLKLTALNHSANSLLILPRIELEFHFYQKCTLPIKLKNLLKYKEFKGKKIFISLFFLINVTINLDYEKKKMKNKRFELPTPFV